MPDPYFSATKLEWILERADEPRAELAFGTVDSWLVWKLTEGAAHVTDVTNASRTMLLSSGRRSTGTTSSSRSSASSASLLPRVVAVERRRRRGPASSARRVPIAGLAGDQQAALFGQGCFAPGDAKATYGTGCFVLVNAGHSDAPPPHGLLRTAAAVAPGEAPQFALEGSVLVGGAALQWLRDGLGLIAGRAARPRRSRPRVESSDGVVFVPALTGLGSPYWDPDVRGLITGLTRGTTRAHLVRATLEAIAFQVADVLDAFPGELDVAARRRRSERESLPHAAPGGPPRLPGRDRGGRGGDGARSRGAGGPGRAAPGDGLDDARAADPARRASTSRHCRVTRPRLAATSGRARCERARR